MDPCPCFPVSVKAQSLPFTTLLFLSQYLENLEAFVLCGDTGILNNFVPSLCRRAEYSSVTHIMTSASPVCKVKFEATPF